ncbi:MAG TPA: ROK family protein, partial [Pseudonocardia sp.]|nr:ROK family protein [Pseudonocardia sp.]
MLTVGVDVGGTSVRAGVVDEDGAVLDTARAATPGQDRA